MRTRWTGSRVRGLEAVSHAEKHHAFFEPGDLALRLREQNAAAGVRFYRRGAPHQAPLQTAMPGIERAQAHDLIPDPAPLLLWVQPQGAGVEGTVGEHKPPAALLIDELTVARGDGNASLPIQVDRGLAKVHVIPTYLLIFSTISHINAR